MSHARADVQERVIQVSLALVGLLHLAPLTGVIGATWLEALYGVTLAGPDITILMRHRAVLLAIVGGLLLAAALRPGLRLAALTAGLASVASFLLLALADGGYNRALRKVVIADVVALVLLLHALVLQRSRS